MTSTPRAQPTGDPLVDAVLAEVEDHRDTDLAARLQTLTAAHRRLADHLAGPAAPQPQPGPPGE